MKEKIITIILTIILTTVPVLIIPNIWGPSNIVRIVVLLACGLALLVTTLLTINNLRFEKTDIPILIFGVLAILSTFFSVEPFLSTVGQKNQYEGLFAIITYILIYYNAKYYFRNYKKFIYVLSVIYILICAFSLVQFYVGNKITLKPIFSKGANGTFGNTNFMGNFVSIILPAFILGFIFKNKKIFFVGSAFSFSAMVVCIARSAWVAFGVVSILILIYLIMQKNKEYWKRLFVLIITFAICFGVIHFTDVRKTVNKQINKVQKETTQIMDTGITNRMGSGRIETWKFVLRLIKEKPILGCGVGSLKLGLFYTFPGEITDYMLKYGESIDTAHNEYLQIAGTMGIPALLTYLTFIGLILFRGLKQTTTNTTLTTCKIVIISYLTQAFFNMSTIGIAPIFWFILGITSRLISLEKTSNPTDEPT